MVVKCIHVESLFFLRKFSGPRNPPMGASIAFFGVLSRSEKPQRPRLKAMQKTTKRYLTLEQSEAAIPSVLDAVIDIARGLQLIDGAKNRVTRQTVQKLNHKKVVFCGVPNRGDCRFVLQGGIMCRKEETSKRTAEVRHFFLNFFVSKKALQGLLRRFLPKCI